MFVCEGVMLAGVADGVGGWAKQGIDPGEYARELMARSEGVVRRRACGQEVKGAGGGGGKQLLEPFAVLSEAYHGVKAAGASTACIVALHDIPHQV
ncbi:putative protein-serine/threonine phosphatase [Dioscorea sansibarensis]